MADDRIPVILDLRLDADEYKGEITRLGRDIQELQTAITKVANIDTSKLTSSMKTSTERYINAARDYGKALKEYQDTQYRSASAEKETKATAQLLESERKLRNAQREFLSMSDSDQLSKDYAEKLKQAKKLKAELDKLNQKSKEMSQVGASEKQWETINVHAQALKEKIYAITNELRKGADAGKLFADDDLNKNNELIKLAIQNIKTYRKEVQGIASSIKVKKDTNTPEYTEAYQKQLKEVERLEAALDKAREKYNKLLATGGDTPKALAGMRYDLERMQGKAQDVGAKLSEMVNAGEAFKVGRGDAAAELERVNSATEHLTANAGELSNTINQASGGISGVSGALGRVISIGTRVGQVLHVAFTGAKKAVVLAAKGVRVLLKGVAKLANFAKKLFSGIKNLISKIISLRKHGSKTTDGLSKGFKKLQRHILMFGFGFRTAYFAIKRLRRIFTDAFKTMVAQYPKLNAQLNSFTMALNRLKGSLGTMFQPLISVAIPVIVRLMEYLSKATEVAANFFAVLTGQRVIYRAVSNQEDYAASLNDTAKAEEKARKEHEKTVASYDKLDIIDQDKNTGSDSSGSINTPDLPLNVTYEEVPVESAISDFAERVKQAWAAADFTEIGEILTKKALAILEKFRKEIVPKITGFINKLANVIVTFVNGADFTAIGAKIGEIINDIVDQLDAEKLGQALASIWNIVIRYFDGLINEIDWTQLGQKIAQFIRNLIETIDVQAVISAISGLINGIKSALRELINGIPWIKYAEALGKNINKLFADIDWKEAGETLGDAIGTILSMLGKFLVTVDWELVASSVSEFARGLLQRIKTALDETEWSGIASSISGLIKGLDLSGLAQDVCDIIISLIRGAMDLLANTDWQTVATEITTAAAAIINGLANSLAEADPAVIFGALIDFIKGISWEDLFESIGAIIGNSARLIVTIAEGLWNLIKEAWNKVVEWWHENALQDGEFTIEGLLMGIGRALRNIGTWIYNHIFKPFIDGFKRAFGIHSPSTVMEEQGGFIIDGLLNGIVAAWRKIKKFFIDTIDNIKQWSSNAWQKVQDAWSGAVTWFDRTIIQPIANFFSGMWDGLKNGAVTAWNGIKDVFSRVGEFFSDTFSRAWSGIVSVFSVAGEIFVDIRDGIVNAFKWIVNQIIRGINTVVSVPFNGINWALQKLRDVNILGLRPFSWIQTISVPQIPELAKGAVIPPNKEFLAVLGDQKSGTNIEAPLDTIKQAVREVLGTTGNSASREPISLQLDGREIARVVWDENQKLYKQTGKFQSIYNM